MEYHWYEDYWAMPRNLPRGHEFFIGYYQTQRAIHHHVALETPVWTFTPVVTRNS